MGGPGVDQSRDEFNRYRDITPAVGGDRLVETLLSGLGLQRCIEEPVWYPNDAWLVLCIYANQAGDNQQGAKCICG